MDDQEIVEQELMEQEITEREDEIFSETEIVAVEESAADETVVLALAGGDTAGVSFEWASKYRPEIGGILVAYTSGKLDYHSPHIEEAALAAENKPAKHPEAESMLAWLHLQPATQEIKHLRAIVADYLKI